MLENGHLSPIIFFSFFSIFFVFFFSMICFAYPWFLYCAQECIITQLILIIFMIYDFLFPVVS